MPKFLLAICIFSISPHIAYGGFKDICQDVKRDFVNTCYSKSYDLYIPTYAWHNRLTYDQMRIDRYTEISRGVGIGKFFVDEKNNWHGLYAMIFADCIDNVQTLFGYTYLVSWGIDFKFGVGFALTFTQVSNFDYIPVPLPPLPVVEFGYKRIAIQASYVSSYKRNFGNILFVLVRIAIYRSDDNL